MQMFMSIREYFEGLENLEKWSLIIKIWLFGEHPRLIEIKCSQTCFGMPQRIFEILCNDPLCTKKGKIVILPHKGKIILSHV